NVLVFSLTNPSPTDPVVTQAWGSTAPTFTVTAVYDDQPGYGALCTQAQAADITLDVAELYGDSWSIEPFTEQQANPYWVLTPQQQEVLGVGESATVQFALENVVTELQPGLTTLYIAYANVPGYNDGAYALEIQKTVATQGITNFWVANPVIVAGQEASLSWRTLGAARVTLTYPDGDEAAAPDSGRGQIGLQRAGFPLPPPAGTTYTLAAYDGSEQQLGDDRQQTVAVTGTPACTLSVSPDAVVAGDPVTFNW